MSCKGREPTRAKVGMGQEPSTLGDALPAANGSWANSEIKKRKKECNILRWKTGGKCFCSILKRLKFWVTRSLIRMANSLFRNSFG